MSKGRGTPCTEETRRKKEAEHTINERLLIYLVILRVLMRDQKRIEKFSYDPLQCRSRTKIQNYKDGPQDGIYHQILAC